MRKVIMFNMMTLDGFFEGKNREINWHNVDEEFNEFADEQLKSADTLVFGRVTYELMAGYWPAPATIENDPVIARHMNAIPKIVFSRTLEKAEWNNTQLYNGNVVEEITKLKQQAGKNILVPGSANLCSALTEFDLIDEYRVMVNPVILGKGNPLFKEQDHRLNLELLNVRAFNSGNVLLFYKKTRTKNQNTQQ